jgi:hypothetical protein
MRIVDINGKEREVSSIKKIVHKVPDKDGNMLDSDYVEVVIVGRTRTWTEWWPLKDFQRYNPTVVI